MQKTRSVDFFIVLEGAPSLVLDSGQVQLNALDVAILRGTNHAWSNPTDRPRRVIMASHDAS